MNTILFDSGEENAGKQPEANITNPAVAPNIFQGQTAIHPPQAMFPEWDIVPPNQFINPRIKQQ